MDAGTNSTDHEGQHAGTSARSPAVTYVFRMDPDGVPSFTYVSQACEEVYGFTSRQAVADVRLMHDAIHPADRQRFEQTGVQSLQTLQQVTWEGRILRTDGRERFVLITSRPHREPDGSIEWHGVVADRSRTGHPALTDASSDAPYDHEDLLGILGHEMGAPLAAIVGYADWGVEVLKRGPEASRTDTVDTILERCFEVIARQAQRLNLLRDDLVATASLDAGTTRVYARSVNVKERLQAAADLRLRDLTVSINCPNGLTCWAQPSHLDQILANLVANAERFATTQITLTASAFGDRIRISVADDGPGVAPQMINSLFTRFSHSGAEPSSQSGTGLGLYVVRALVIASGGTVVYEPQDRGARFTFTLPPGQPTLTSPGPTTT